jgi:hypothetical protein
MRHIVLGIVLSLGLAGSPLYAQEISPSPLSGVIKADGLSAGVAFAEQQPDGDRKQFALGALNTLQAVEHILQVRYNNYSGRLPLVPGGTTQLRLNPNAKFDPAFIENALVGAADALATAQGHLENLGEDEFALVINLDDIWFDVDADGQRADDEGLRAFLGAALNVPAPEEGQMPIVQFDRADGRWLLAYTHVLQGMAEMVLSVDPTPAMTKVTDGVAHMRELGIVKRDPIFGDDNIIDTIAVIINALHGPADQARTQKALGHFQAMISANKEFWRLVALEEDDQAEWLPNPSQQSAFGVPVTAEVAAGWQDVLDELESVLAGDALVPFWRVEGHNAASVGININKFLNAPGDLDLFLMVHGAAFAPYMEKGRVVDIDVLERFSELTGGQGGMFALWFN